MSVGLVSLDILAFVTGAAAINHNGEYVLVGGAAMVPLLWLSLFENSEVQNMMVDSYKNGRDIQVALNEQELLKSRLQMSKKMNALGVVMAVASSALIAAGGVAALNGKNYGRLMLWGGIITIPFDAVVMLVSHECYNSAVVRYRNP